MESKNALVIWSKSRKTSVVPASAFLKSLGKTGKEKPLQEGETRLVILNGVTYECKILRISRSKKYLESLLVTKSGEILLHGTTPPSKCALARKSYIFRDDTVDIKIKRRVLRALNVRAEEQQPNIRLDGAPECNHKCSICCTGAVPNFPNLPEGFVHTLVCLAEYFQHFHKSTAANILAAGKALAKMTGDLNTWQWPSEGKVELVKGMGVYIDESHLNSILSNTSNAKKPQHLVLIKSLLTHLLGIEKYLDYGAERMDRRLLSAVVAFANGKYPDLAQPIERCYRSINLNRSYLLKRKGEGSQDYPFVRQPSEITGSSDFSVKRPKISEEMSEVIVVSDEDEHACDGFEERNSNACSTSPVENNVGSPNISVSNVGTKDCSIGGGSTANEMNNTNDNLFTSNNVRNKIVILQKPNANSEVIQPLNNQNFAPSLPVNDRLLQDGNISRNFQLPTQNVSLSPLYPKINNPSPNSNIANSTVKIGPQQTVSMVLGSNRLLSNRILVSNTGSAGPGRTGQSLVREIQNAGISARGLTFPVTSVSSSGMTFYRTVTTNKVVEALVEPNLAKSSIPQTVSSIANRSIVNVTSSAVIHKPNLQGNLPTAVSGISFGNHSKIGITTSLPSGLSGVSSPVGGFVSTSLNNQLIMSSSYPQRVAPTIKYVSSLKPSRFPNSSNNL